MALLVQILIELILEQLEGLQLYQERLLPIQLLDRLHQLQEEVQARFIDNLQLQADQVLEIRIEVLLQIILVTLLVELLAQVARHLDHLVQAEAQVLQDHPAEVEEDVNQNTLNTFNS